MYKQHLRGSSTFTPRAQLAAAGAAVLEKKEDGPTLAQVSDGVAKVNTAFEEFKSTNDQRLAELEKKGTSDPLLDEKLKKINAELDKIEPLNEALQEQKALEQKLADLQKQYDTIETALNRAGAGGETDERKTFDWAKAAALGIHNGMQALSDEQKSLITDIHDEFKALNVADAAQGGFLVPTEMATDMIKDVTEVSPVRSLARVRQTTMRSMMLPKRTGQFAAVWVHERGTRSETTGLEYGMVEIPTHEIYALVDLSSQFLEDAAFDMEAEIRMEATEQFSVAEGNAFVNGTGQGKPEGFLQNSDVATVNSGNATAITGDGLISVKTALKTAYAPRARYLLNRTSLGDVRKLKDQQDQYLWVPGLRDGRPNTIDGDPYTEMPDMPNAGAGAKAVAYGDFFRGYTWIDRIVMELTRDPYTQATAGNVRFIVRKRVGGGVTQAEAIKTLTCAV